MMSQFAIEFDACRVTQSKLSHPSLRLEPPQQTRNGSAVTKGHEKSGPLMITFAIIFA